MLCGGECVNSFCPRRCVFAQLRELEHSSLCQGVVRLHTLQQSLRALVQSELGLQQQERTAPHGVDIDGGQSNAETNTKAKGKAK